MGSFPQGWGHLEASSRNENLTPALWEYKEVKGLTPACK